MRGHVEQIVDQAHHVPDLAIDDRALVARELAALDLHQMQRRDDRRERIAQLVAEHREELVLGAMATSASRRARARSETSNATTATPSGEFAPRGWNITS